MCSSYSPCKDALAFSPMEEGSRERILINNFSKKSNAPHLLRIFWLLGAKSPELFTCYNLILTLLAVPGKMFSSKL